MILYDPQTSGPLAVSVAFREKGVEDATVIGEVEETSTLGVFICHFQ